MDLFGDVAEGGDIRDGLAGDVVAPDGGRGDKRDVVGWETMRDVRDIHTYVHTGRAALF